MSYTQFTSTVQTKLWQFCDKFKLDFKKPEQRFIHQMLFGILKSGRVEINSIARSLQEEIPIKKVHKRLGAHLGKPGMWRSVAKATLKAQSWALKGCRFVLYDLSDIQKEYAQKMEGLTYVYDGSKDKTGNGYWLSNMSAVDEQGSTLIPLYSELYSHQAEECGQNQKILDAVDTVLAYCPKQAVTVMDRGCDREIIISALVQGQREFIIRQTGKRKVYLKDRPLPFKSVSRKVRLNYRHEVERIHKNKKERLVYDCGAQKIRLSKDGADLWLVVLKEKKRGYCWLLCRFENITDAKEAVALAIKGYGYRWKIEEVHRQMKKDYALESIRLHRYEALKTMNALLWMALSFLYTRLEPIALEIIYHPKLGLANRKKLKDALRFIYYKLAESVKRILAVADFRRRRKRPSRNEKQIEFNFLW
jgi:hypothetical protein